MSPFSLRQARCTRCHARVVWSSQLCWECHRAYAAAIRDDPHVASGLAKGFVIGTALVAGAVGAGASGVVALIVLPIAMAFGSHASRRHRRAWIARTGPTLPQARALSVGPRAPGSGTDR